MAEIDPGLQSILSFAKAYSEDENFHNQVREQTPSEVWQQIHDTDVALGERERDDAGVWEPAVSLGYNAAKSFTGTLRGLGATAEELGMGSGMKDYFDETLRTNRQWDNPSTQNAVDKVFGMAGSALGSTALPAAAAFVPGVGAYLSAAITFGQSFGENVQRNREAYGIENDEKNYALAALESVVDTFIETGLGTLGKVGKSAKTMALARKAKYLADNPAAKRQVLREMVNLSKKKLGKEATGFWQKLGRYGASVLENGAEEAGEESLQMGNSFLWQVIGGDDRAKFDWNELGENALAGFVGGTFLGAGTEALNRGVNSRVRNQAAQNANIAQQNVSAEDQTQNQDQVAQLPTSQDQSAPVDDYHFTPLTSPEGALERDTAPQQMITVMDEDGTMRQVPMEAAQSAAVMSDERGEMKAAQERGEDGAVAPEEAGTLPDVAGAEQPRPVSTGGLGYETQNDVTGERQAQIPVIDFPPLTAQETPDIEQPAAVNAQETPNIEQSVTGEQQTQVPLTTQNAVSTESQNGVAEQTAPADQENKTTPLASNVELFNTPSDIAFDNEGISEASGKYGKPISPAQLNFLGQQHLDALNRVAKLLGSRIVLVSAPQIDGKNINGFYFKGDRAYVNANALNSADGMTFAAFHEITHRLARANNDAYIKLRNVVINSMSKAELKRQTDKFRRQRANFGKCGVALDTDIATMQQEFVCAMVSDMMQTDTFWERLAKQDMNLAQRIFNILKTLSRKLFSGDQKLSEYDRIFKKKLDKVINSAARFVSDASASARQDAAQKNDITGMVALASEMEAAQSAAVMSDERGEMKAAQERGEDGAVAPDEDKNSTDGSRAPAAPKTRIKMNLGEKVSVSTPQSEMKTDTAYAFVDLDDLVTSDDARYDQTLQPRNRTTRASEAQISSISQHLEPERLLDSPVSDSGSPIIDQYGQVISGNGRTIALRRALNDKKSREAYRTAIAGFAKKHNMTVPENGNPVLVRILNPKMTQGDMEKFAEYSNRDNKLTRSIPETAEADAKSIINNNLIKLIVPNDEGKLLTAENRSFVRGFVHATGDFGLLQEDGSPTRELETRIERALLGVVVGNDRTLLNTLINKSYDLGINRQVNGILMSSPALLEIGKRKKEYDISDDLRSALTRLVDYHSQIKAEQIKSLEDFKNQGTLFGEHFSEEADLIFDKIADAKSIKEVREYFNTYADLAEKEEVDTPDMFGNDPKSKSELLRKAAENGEQRNTENHGNETERNGSENPRQTEKQPDTQNRDADARQQQREPGSQSGSTRSGAETRTEQKVTENKNAGGKEDSPGFRKIDFAPGTVNLDLGGGRFDEGTQYLESKGVKNLIFDPVNRSPEHNRKVFDAVKNGGVDSVTCNNVLNVIAEPEARDNVILQCAKALKPGGKAYFTVYEGNASGIGRQSQADSYQNNRKTADYIEEIEKHFGDVSLKNKVITASDPKTEGKLSAWATDKSFENPLMFSVARTPQNVDDYLKMESHPHPDKIAFSNVKELYDIYKKEYLGKTFKAISGNEITFKPGHFFRLIAGTPREGIKGWIAKAANAEEAIRMIENGKVDFTDIAGFQKSRAENINLFKDVLTDGDFWYSTDNQKIIFGKKYQGLKNANGFIAVTLELDKKGELGPVSFYPKQFTEKMFDGRQINWNIVNSLDHTKASGDVSSRGKSAGLNDTISSFSENARVETKKNKKNSGLMFSVTTEQDKDFAEAEKRGDVDVAKKMVLAAAKAAMPDTMVVDDNGNPRVVYHGTHNDFTVFDLARSGENTNNKGIFGNGFYFSDSKDGAAYYNRVDGHVVKDGSGNVMPAYLAIKKPFVWSNPNAIKIAERLGGYPAKEIEVSKRYKRLLPLTKENEIFAFTEKLKAAGYDGVIYDYSTTREGNAKEYVVFEPNQIKSAEPFTYDDDGKLIPLSERFNDENDDIRFSVNDKIDSESRDFKQRDQIVRDYFGDEYIEQRDEDLYKVAHHSESMRKAAELITALGGARDAIEHFAKYSFDIDAVSTMAMGTLLGDQALWEVSPSVREKFHKKYYDITGTKTAQAMEARKAFALDLNNIESIQRYVNTMLAGLEAKDPEKFRKLREQIKKQFGFDILSLPKSVLDSPKQLNAVLVETSAKCAGAMDKVYEYWINSLFGFGTHVANTTGNLTMAAYNIGAKRALVSLLNVAMRRKDVDSFGEFKEIFRAIHWKEACQRAAFAYQFEMLRQNGDKYTGTGAAPAISGKLGKVVRFNTNLLSAADEFAKQVIIPIEASSYAYKQAKQKGMNKEQIRDYIAEQVANTKSEAYQYGAQKAEEYGLRNKPGRLVAALQAVANNKNPKNFKEGFAKWLLRFTMPFLRVGENMTRFTTRYSPLGSVNLAWQTGKALLGKRKFDNEYFGLLAEQVVAWGSLMALASIGTGDDDEPRITGTGANYGSNEAKFKANKIPPYSIRFGNTYYSYRRIEPLAGVVAMMVDAANAINSKDENMDGGKIVSGAFKTLKSVILDKSVYKTISEVADVITDPEHSAMRPATNFVASWIPNYYREIARNSDENFRDQRSTAPTFSEEWFEDNFWVTVDKMGFRHVAPKIDYFGREIRKTDVEDSAPAGFFARMFATNPINPDANNSAFEKALLKWNAAHSEAEQYYPSLPQYYGKFKDGTRYYFGKEDYQYLCQEAGKLAQKKIERFLTPRIERRGGTITAKEIEWAKKVFAQDRHIVRLRMIKEGRYKRKH